MNIQIANKKNLITPILGFLVVVVCGVFFRAIHGVLVPQNMEVEHDASGLNLEDTQRPSRACVTIRKMENPPRR